MRKPSRFIYIFVLVGTLAGWGAGPVVPVRAAIGSTVPTIKVKAGFEGYYKQNSWLPIQVNLSLSEGSPDFDGWIEASWTNFAPDSARYRRHLQLVAPVNRTAWLYLPSDPRNIYQVQFRLTDASGRILEKRDLNVDTLGPTELLVGVVSDDSNVLNYLGGERLTQPFNRNSILFSDYSPPGGRRPAPGPQARPVTRLARLSGSDLPPEMAGWDSLDGLVLTDLTNQQVGDQSLNQSSLAQAAAGWLAQGRFLIGAGDSTLQRGGFLTDLWPVRAAGGPKTSAFPAELKTFFKSGTPPAQLLIAQSQAVTGAKIEINQAGLPLLVSRPFGLGLSLFLATDLKPWTGANGLALWNNLLGNYEPHIGYIQAQRLSEDSPYESWVNQVSPNSRLNAPPDVNLLGIVLVIYTLTVGPGLFWLSRRLKRPMLGWLVVPGLAVGLSLLLAIVGVFTSGEPVVVSRLSIISLGQTAQGDLKGGTVGLATIYSSGRANFNLDTDEQSLSLPMDSTNSGAFFSTSQTDTDTRFLTVQQGNGGGYGPVRLGLAEDHSFSLEQNGLSGLSGGIVTQLTAQGDELRGTLENRSGQDWADLSVWKAGGQVYNLPNLKAGENITLDSKYAARPSSHLLNSILGVERVSLGNLRDPQASSQERYVARKVAVLTTFLGPDGEVLPKPTDRLYLVAWRQDAGDFGLRVHKPRCQAADLTLLFETVALR